MYKGWQVTKEVTSANGVRDMQPCLDRYGNRIAFVRWWPVSSAPREIWVAGWGGTGSLEKLTDDAGGADHPHFRW